MAGQGSTTLQIGERLERFGWDVAYMCIPNTPHIGAVPIPTKRGISRQRYPDVVATTDDVLSLIEVEIRMSESVAHDTEGRFREMREALADPAVYLAWSAAVERECGVSLPADPSLSCCLVTTRAWNADGDALVEGLAATGIRVVTADEFDPHFLL